MNEATLLRAGDRPILRFQRHLPRPIEDVWRAVTEPEQLKAWFPTRIEIDEWKVGAQLRHHFDEHDIDPLDGEVLECDPPRRLVHLGHRHDQLFARARLWRRHDDRAHRGVGRVDRGAQRGRMGVLPRSTRRRRRRWRVAAPLRALRRRLRADPRTARRPARRISRTIVVTWPRPGVIRYGIPGRLDIGTRVLGPISEATRP